MKTIRNIVSGNSLRIPPRLKLISTRLGSLILLFQRMPIVQFLFPEASVVGGASVANSVSLAVTTVVGLGVFDSVAGQTTIDEVTPLAVDGRDPASSTAANAVNVPASVSAPLNFEFACTTAPSRPKSWQIVSGTLPTGLTMDYTATTPTGAYNNFIKGIPSPAGIYPVSIRVYRSANYSSDNVTQSFNICVLGFSTQPAASTTINSGSTTTLTCVAAGNPVATTFHPATATLTYEWYEGTSGTLGSILGTSPSFTTPALSSSTSYWVRIKSVLGTSTVYANSDTAVVNVTVNNPYDNWASGLPTGQNGPTQTPLGDGVTNLEKFAFNLDPVAADVRRLTPGAGGAESAGLPCGVLAGGKLRIEFLRRKASTNPGITYVPQFSSGLDIWEDFGGAPVSVTPLVGDSDWERVVVDDPAGGGLRFARVKVAQIP